MLYKKSPTYCTVIKYQAWKLILPLIDTDSYKILDTPGEYGELLGEGSPRVRVQHFTEEYKPSFRDRTRSREVARGQRVRTGPGGGRWPGDRGLEEDQEQGGVQGTEGTGDRVNS